MKNPHCLEINDKQDVVLEAVPGAKFLMYEIAKRRLYLGNKDRYAKFEYLCREFKKYRKAYESQSPSLKQISLSYVRLDKDLLNSFEEAEDKTAFCRNIDADIDVLRLAADISRRYGYVATDLYLDRNLKISEHPLLYFLKINEEIYWKKELRNQAGLENYTERHLSLDNSSFIGESYPLEGGYERGVFCDAKMFACGLDIRVNKLEHVKSERQLKKIMQEIEMFLRYKMEVCNVEKKRKGAVGLTHEEQMVSGGQKRVGSINNSLIKDDMGGGSTLPQNLDKKRELEKDLVYGAGNANSVAKRILGLIIWDAKEINQSRDKDIYEELTEALEDVDGVSLFEENKIFPTYKWINSCIIDNFLHKIP